MKMISNKHFEGIYTPQNCQGRTHVEKFFMRTKFLKRTIALPFVHLFPLVNKGDIRQL
jgi:hypothetical protein